MGLGARTWNDDAAPVAELRLRIRCSECPIRHRAICSQCSSEELQTLDSMKRYKTFSAGERIAWAGERMSAVGSVIAGVATLSSTLADGRRQMVGLLLPSDFLGRPGRDVAAYDVVAATDVTFCMFQTRKFEQMIAQSPNLGNRLLEMTLDELDCAREWMLVLGRKTAREKMASLFVYMARRDAALHHAYPSDGLHFPLYISREAMADYLGLTIETVSRQISALRRDKVVELVGSRTAYAPSFGRLLAESADETAANALV